METFWAQLFNGLALGSMYALMVTGFNLLLLVGGIIQYAYPHIVVIAMYTAWGVLGVTGNNIYLAIPAAIVVATVLSIVQEPLFRPLVKRGATDQTFFVALGIAMILTEFMAKHVHQGRPIAFIGTFAGAKAAVQFGQTAITAGQLFTFFGTLVAVAILLFILYRTMTGRAFRSMAQSPFIAKLVGIPITRTALTTYGITGFIGGITAIFLTMSIGSAYPAMGDDLALKVVATMLFAGLGNLFGGMICGLILGVAEGLATGYLKGDWANAAAFAMIMIVVMFRPSGLFGVKA